MGALNTLAAFIWRLSQARTRPFPPGPVIVAGNAGPGAAWGKRRYAAAKTDRLTADWLAGNLSANSELRMDLRTLRFRSRQLARDHHYYRKWLGSLQRNVVGPAGIRVKSVVTRPDGSPDRRVRDVINKAFQDWGEVGICSVDGQMSWEDVQRLILRTIAQDGDIIVRHIRGADAGNRWGYAVQLMESDHLEENQQSRTVPGDHTLFMGVEADKFRRPVAFHLTGHHPGEDQIALQQARRIVLPASEMLLPFMIDRAGQARGVPWGHAAMARLNDIGRYEEAEIIASRAASSKMGFIQTATGTEYQGDDVTEDGDIISEFAPGTIEQLPAGTEFKPFDPQHPNSGYEAFSRAMLHGVTAGLDSSYAEITGDLSNANFSSIRQGALSDRDQWRLVQVWLVNRVLKPIRGEWLAMALTTQAVPLPLRRFDEFVQAKWQPRGWSWVDPQKEVKAAKDAIELKTESRTHVAGQTGRDIEDIFDEISDEQALAEAKGIDLSPPAAPAPIGQPAASDDPDDDEEKEGSDDD